MKLRQIEFQVDLLGSSMIENDEISDLYKKIMINTVKLTEVHDALAVAAVMMAQSLSIYRSILPEEDYNMLIEKILSRRDKVITFLDKGSLH